MECTVVAVIGAFLVMVCPVPVEEQKPEPPKQEKVEPAKIEKPCVKCIKA